MHTAAKIGQLLPASINAMIDPPSLSALSDKICGRSSLAARVAQMPRPLVFTNGVFDVLHRGHVMYLAQARALGQSLLVALNTDTSARRLGKGPDRPLNNEADRAFVMAALASTSLVTWFEEDTPLELIAQIRPDILVKGGDYDMAKLAETRVVEAYGGRALALPFVDGYSTTALVKKIREG
ncbi:MAG: rfaE bifunctional protein nucleotidyltransferase chain/domain [Rhodoferax sp.]|jgi:rfaE bifunctional protein nucleotidyltransferase chain/domain